MLVKWNNPIVPSVAQGQPRFPPDFRLPGDMIFKTNCQLSARQGNHTFLHAPRFWEERIASTEPPTFYSESLEETLCEAGDYLIIARESHTDSAVVQYHHIPPRLFQRSMFPKIEIPRRHSPGVSVDQSVAPTPNSQYHRVRSNIFLERNDCF